MALEDDDEPPPQWRTAPWACERRARGGAEGCRMRTGADRWPHSVSTHSRITGLFFPTQVSEHVNRPRKTKSRPEKPKAQGERPDAGAPAGMLPGHAGNLVRNLYRRILIAGKDYPTGLDAVKKKAKAEFAKRAHLEDGLELRRAVNYGRYMVREMQGVIMLKKYRAMRQRYVVDPADAAAERRRGENEQHQSSSSSSSPGATNTAATQPHDRT